MPPVLEVALAGIATALATGLGALPIGAAAERGLAWRPALLGAAAGAMVVVSLVGLLLPALEDGSALTAGAGLGLGVLFLFAARSLLRAHGLHDARLSTARDRRAALVFLVLFVHSLPEGFAIGSAWASETAGLGFFVLLAIAVQNIPEGTVTAIPLALAGAGRGRQVLAAIATSAPQPVGAVIAFLLVEAGRRAPAGLLRVRRGRDACAGRRRCRTGRLGGGSEATRLGRRRRRRGRDDRRRPRARRLTQSEINP